MSNRKDSGTVATERDSTIHQGEYTISKGLITVWWNGRQKTTQLGGSADTPGPLRASCSGELIDESKRGR
jgi:hypothetical protein